MMEVRCCCEPSNMLGLLNPGLPYQTREMDNGELAYVAHELPIPVLIEAAKRKPRKSKPRTWKEK